jgi:NAD(P)-dependent dehydrogenase (short-subunit alcohol dehydrogenase family)
VSTHQWTLRDMPDLDGKRALVTGATAGLGEHTVLELARKGAEVIMTGRSPEKLDQSVEHVRKALPNASVAPLLLDLADLGSVRRAAREAAAYGALDILVNNAGVMATPAVRTVDGFDLQMGTNHFGHFALTGLLLDSLLASGGARVVTVSSLMHRAARTVPLTDPRTPSGRYRKWEAYAQSKLANLLFAFELERRARRAELPLTSLAAHPGYASTKLVDTGPNMNGMRPDGAILVGATRMLAQRAAVGAMPTLMAATMPGLPGGTYVGPKGCPAARGRPPGARPRRPARDEALAGAWWDLSAEATGVAYP